MSKAKELEENRIRVEQEYDALITELRRCQNRLSAKAEKANSLPLPEYREWHEQAKQAVADVQAQIAAKKQERAEARRKSNNWRPKSPSAPAIQWVPWPNKPGFWWNYYNQIFNVVEAYRDGDSGEVLVEELDEEEQLDGVFQFIPFPSAP